MVNTTRKAMKTRVMDNYLGTYTVKAARLGDQATTLGAAAWAKHTLAG